MANTISPTASASPALPVYPGSQPAQLQPGEQEKIQGAMLQNAIGNRDSIAKDLAKPSGQFIADETTKLQQQRQSDASSYDFQIDAAGRNIPSNPDFWTGVQQHAVQDKATTLAKDDQLIATVPQREPELRAKKQSDLSFYNQRIAQLQAGPVTISQDEAMIYRQLFQSQAAAAARASLYQSSFAAAAPRPPVAGLFGY